MMRARKIQSPGAWRLPASLRIFRSSSMFWGARACSSFGTISSLPARRSSHALMYTAFEERSTRQRMRFRSARIGGKVSDGVQPLDGRDSARVFDEHRGLLNSVAYRILGSVTDAEDTVQEAWLRWSGVNPS